jgi:hypothetical protein
MSPRLPRRVLPTVALMAALALPLPARAAAVRPQPNGPAFLEDLAATFRHWFAHLWIGTFEKSGAQIDPDGQATPDNGPIIDPNGRTTPASTPGVRGDNGAMVDPDG